MEYLNGNRKTLVTNSPVFNDDGRCFLGGYKPNHVNVTIGQFSRKSWVAVDSMVRNVSSTVEQAVGALMEDETTLIKRREKSEAAASKSPPNKSIAGQFNPSILPSRVKMGPSPQRPILALDHGQHSTPEEGYSQEAHGGAISCCLEERKSAGSRCTSSLN
ncbi:hypothetical protein Ancab_036391 [Ancistrocladus abbreviatus]